jgi:hypothetical protein
MQTRTTLVALGEEAEKHLCILRIYLQNYVLMRRVIPSHVDGYL